MRQNPPPPDLYLWSESQESDMDQIFVLIAAWQKARPAAKDYLCNPYRVMDVTDDVFKGLLEIYSDKNVPSPIKKAAHLCHAIAARKPLKSPDQDSPYSEMVDGLTNAIMGFDFAAHYLLCSQFMKNGGAVEPKNPLFFQSKHFELDFIHRLASAELTVMGLSLILELMLYESNDHLVGIIDPTVEERLRKLVPGFDLFNFFTRFVPGF